mmetsp:Transcript_23405/g.54457  ORF Transcript_23405/g.54457 Transcript_23405/m.54457 type:complete len:388 (+) Transcript_23405:282-1445(+)
MGTWASRPCEERRSRIFRDLFERLGRRMTKGASSGLSLAEVLRGKGRRLENGESTGKGSSRGAGLFGEEDGGGGSSASSASSSTTDTGEAEASPMDIEDSNGSVSGAFEEVAAEQDGDRTVAHDAANVVLHVGLGGHVVTLPVEADCSFPSLQPKVCSLLGRQVHAQFTAADQVIDSVEALLSAHSSGLEIYALLLKDLADMTLDEIVTELTLQEAELQGHLFTLSRLPASSTAVDVANYLWSNQVLISAKYAEKLFDALLPRLTRCSRQLSLRGELILVLHSFCSEPYAVWEPNDGHDECLWANMKWGHSEDASSSPFSAGLIYVTRGEAVNLHPSSSSAQAKKVRNDVSNLRSVLRARRFYHAQPLASMHALSAYGLSWRKMMNH